MRLAAFAFVALAACATLPPDGTPYFETTISGDNLYPASAVRIYATDQRVMTSEPHPLNQNRGAQDVTSVPGAFAAGLNALETLPPQANSAVSQVPPSPDACCHQNFNRSFVYFDGNRVNGITEAVWRRADSVPPFVDLPISPN